MNVLLWDVPRHLEDYTSLAAMEPRAFQGLFQDTKLNQNDLTEKKKLWKTTTGERKLVLCGTFTSLVTPLKYILGDFGKGFISLQDQEHWASLGEGKKKLFEVQYIFSYPKLCWRFLHTQIYSITFLYNTMPWIPYSLIFPLFYSCQGSRIKCQLLSAHTHNKSVEQPGIWARTQGLLVFCQQLQSQCIQKKKKRFPTSILFTWFLSHLNVSTLCHELVLRYTNTSYVQLALLISTQARQGTRRQQELTLFKIK